MRATRPGLWLIGVLAILLLLAMNYRDNALYLLFALMSACAVVAAFEARRQLRGVQVIADPIAPIFAGEAAHLSLRLEVADGHPRTLLRLSVDDHVAVIPRADDGRIIDLSLPGLTRGAHPLSRCTLATTHPYGLVRVARSLPLAGEILVYPAPVGDRPLPGDDGSGPDDRSDFAGHRSYRPGDPPQHIDWKITARSGRAMVKRFDGGGDLRRHQLTLADADDGEVEAALAQLCRWICLAEERQEDYGLSLSVHQLSLDHGGPHRDRCLEALARHGR